MRLVVAVILTIVAVGAMTLVVLTPGATRTPADAPRPGEPPVFVGRAACADCHADQVALWQGSDHDLAMDVADEHTVLGDFDGATLVANGVTTSFSRRDGSFQVRTDGPDGAPAAYDVAYTFGARPLQQYLVAFPGGRYQTLTTAWDTRPSADGGQRWFSLHPGEAIEHDDALHWTRPNQTWNFMCAECHSTGLEKGYDAERDTYDTTWSEIDVSCEACHGPGSEHVRRALSGALSGADSGLLVHLKDHDDGAWVIAPDRPTAERSVPRTSNPQAEACGRCHARRGIIRADYEYGRPLLETHRPQLLTEPLYYDDGQIRAEVYVYGSFRQSAMYAAGVTCSDCHEPHSGRVRAPGNALCLQCHRPEVFDTPAHHFHAAGEPGSFCVDCHMPERAYMQVDPRRDHSLRVPRPDLSVRLGTPNACTMCHSERDDAWAAAQTLAWYGPDRRATTHYGEILHAGRTGAAGAPEALAQLAGDAARPAIVRATALAMLASSPGPAALAVATDACADADPLVRAAAATALASAAPAARVPRVMPLLEDPVLGVRIEAARVLAPVPADLLTPAQRQAVATGVEAYVTAERASAERPEAHLNIGVVRTDQGRYAEAEAAYRTALRLDPDLVEAIVNLADLYRMLGRDAEGEALLRAAVSRIPDVAILHHVLGLQLVRSGRGDQALGALRRASELGPHTPHYAYVYALALDAEGRRRDAADVIEAALRRHPRDAELLDLRRAFQR